MHPQDVPRAWARGIDDPEPRHADQRYPPALTEAEMRAMYERNRTPEVRRLLWEVARLQALARRASQFASCFPLYDSQLTATAFHIILAALRRDLEKESWLVAEAASEEEIFDRAPPTGKREARRRRNG